MLSNEESCSPITQVTEKDESLSLHPTVPESNGCLKDHIVLPETSSDLELFGSDSGDNIENGNFHKIDHDSGSDSEHYDNNVNNQADNIPEINVNLEVIDTENNITVADNTPECNVNLEVIDTDNNSTVADVTVELSDNEEDAVKEIETVVSHSSESDVIPRSLSDKFLQFSKSVSPPIRNSATSSLSFNSKVSSSLNNLANKLFDSKPNNTNRPLSSASMSDLDRFREPAVMLKDLKDTVSVDSMSIASNDFDAYDKIKRDAASIDEYAADDFSSRDTTPPMSISELEKLVKKLEYELDVANGTIKHVYDESTKQVHEVSMKYEAKISHIDKKFVECIKEKDTLKMSLDECMDARRKLQSNKENLIKSLSNQADENERLRAKLHMSTDDGVKLKKELDARTYEVSEMKKIIKKLQDDLSSASIKVQWANSKQKSEAEAHQSTKTRLAGMDAKIREAKEEANVIRTNCQAMIDKYQNSEEIQSNALGSKLEKLESEHADLKDQFELLKSKYENKCVEQETVSRQLEQIKDQLFEKEADYRRVLQESKHQEDGKNELANQLEDLDEQLNSYNELKAELRNAYHNNQVLDTELINLRGKLVTTEKSNEELTEKEKSNLEYFQRISSKNAELQLDVNSLKLEHEGNIRELSSLRSDYDELSNKYSEVSQKYSIQVGESTSSISDLETKISELQAAKESLESQVRDLKNDAMVAKRKNQADNKDLIRQIEQFRKQFERQEESMRRTESVNSLESSDRRNRSGASSEAEDSASISNDSGATMSLDNARLLLVERLCSLQRVLAKRQEKIEFYESHVSTLTKDVSKKSRIIQTLLLRVETGERTKLASDAYKSSASSSQYNVWGQATNGMTLKLSTEINEKLQQVLEDTLFKNMTLKENIKTLGDEIDRLNAK